MRYRTIGTRQNRVPAIGVGCMGVGGRFTSDFSDDVNQVATLRLAFDRGMTFVDTAEVYAAGHSEELVGQAISGRRDEIYLATKVSPEHLRGTDIVASTENSLRRLRTHYIDLYQLHWPNPAVPIEESVGALERLVKAGKVRHIGLSNYSLKKLRDAQRCFEAEALAAIQVEYNLFDRSIEHTLLPYCQEHNIALIAYSPLDQGQICGGPLRRAQLEPIAVHYGCTLAQLALAWLIRQPNVFVIPKAAKPRHVMENATASDIGLLAKDAATIDHLTAGNLVEVPVDRIRVAPDNDGERQIYRTIGEATVNAYGFTPSPVELAAEMRVGDFLKPVRVQPASEPKCGYDFDLTEGRIRYWAWVIAFEGQRDIPVLVRE